MILSLGPLLFSLTVWVYILNVGLRVCIVKGSELVKKYTCILKNLVVCRKHEGCYFNIRVIFTLNIEIGVKSNS